MTYSIVARDPVTGLMGVAVQSHWFSTGSVVAWGEAGVGVVATQAFAEPAHGPRGLALMGAGLSASDALRALLTVDALAAQRQVAVIDASGDVAVHTGESCIEAAGDVKGDGFSCQANMMLRDTVPQAMADAYRSVDGELVDRLLVALDAAEAEGGDIRGRQSAALLIVGRERAPHAAAGTVLELRIEDHPEPLAELRRLVAVHRAYQRMNAGDEHLAAGDTARARAEYEGASVPGYGNPEFAFWRGVMLAVAGDIDGARTQLEQAFRGPGEWRELLRRLPAAGLLPSELSERLADL